MLVVTPEPVLSGFGDMVVEKTDLFGFGDFDSAAATMFVGIGVIFLVVVAASVYTTIKAGAGAERIANRWIDRKYGK